MKPNNLSSEEFIQFKKIINNLTENNLSKVKDKRVMKNNMKNNQLEINSKIKPRAFNLQKDKQNHLFKVYQEKLILKLEKLTTLLKNSIKI
jgi:hypothetical protein